jgi:hypothetical protein
MKITCLLKTDKIKYWYLKKLKKKTHPLRNIHFFTFFLIYPTRQYKGTLNIFTSGFKHTSRTTSSMPMKLRFTL